MDCLQNGSTEIDEETYVSIQNPSLQDNVEKLNLQKSVGMIE